MKADYFYCPNCGYEDYDVFVAYSRSTSENDLYSCPLCNYDSVFAEVEKP